MTLITSAIAISAIFWFLCKIVVAYNDTVDDRINIISIIENMTGSEREDLLSRYEAVAFRTHYFNNLFGLPPHDDYGLDEKDF